MIKGRGLLAQALAKIDNDEYFFYVNGISNSVIEEIPDDNFEVAELTEIAKTIGDRLFIYCSTSLVNSTENFNRPYVFHKHKMENLTKELFPKHLVVRTSNLVGNNPWNTHTLFNFLNNALQNDKEIIVVGSAVRNILDADDFAKMLFYFINKQFDQSCTINLVNPTSYTMNEIVAVFEKVFNKEFLRKDKYMDVAHFDAPCDFSSELVKSCGMDLTDYLSKVIKKYYLKDNS